MKISNVRYTLSIVTVYIYLTKRQYNGTSDTGLPKFAAPSISKESKLTQGSDRTSGRRNTNFWGNGSSLIGKNINGKIKYGINPFVRPPICLGL